MEASGLSRRCTNVSAGPPSCQGRAEATRSTALVGGRIRECLEPSRRAECLAPDEQHEWRCPKNPEAPTHWPRCTGCGGLVGWVSMALNAPEAKTWVRIARVPGRRVGHPDRAVPPLVNRTLPIKDGSIRPRMSADGWCRRSTRLISAVVRQRLSPRRMSNASARIGGNVVDPRHAQRRPVLDSYSDGQREQFHPCLILSLLSASNHGGDT